MILTMRIYILIITIIALNACGNKKNQEQTKVDIDPEINVLVLTDAQMKSAAIATGSIEEKSISSIIKVNGKIDVPPQNMVSISMPLGGYLKSTKLLPGMHVNNGEVIAIMEDHRYIELQQDYLTAKSKLKYAEAEYNRQKELNVSKASSDKILQQAEMEFQTQYINLNALTEKVKLIGLNPKTLAETGISKSVNIYSPIDGYVSKVNVNIGKFVSPTDVLFELVNPADIHLNLMIFERDLEKISIGQKLVAYTNSKPDEKHPCEIILISKDLSSDRTAEVHCHFLDYDKTLLPGMYMNADIEVKSHKTWVTKEEAIVNFEGNYYVFVVLGDNKFEMKKVEPGVKENDEIEILNGEQFAGKSVVIKNAYTLLMALKNKSEE